VGFDLPFHQRSNSGSLFQILIKSGISQNLGKTYLAYLQRLCGESGALPTSILLTEGFDHIEPQPFMRYGPVAAYRATYKGELVVGKTFRTTSVCHLENIHKVSSWVFSTIMQSPYVTFQCSAKEVVGWKCLQHENILPFIGVTSTPSPFSMVSPWMENGNIMNFLKTTPDQNPFSLVGILCASGLVMLICRVAHRCG